MIGLQSTGEARLKEAIEQNDDLDEFQVTPLESTISHVSSPALAHK